jgi:hypothetical protein
MSLVSYRGTVRGLTLRQLRAASQDWAARPVRGGADVVLNGAVLDRPSPEVHSSRIVAARGGWDGR